MKARNVLSLVLGLIVLTGLMAIQAQAQNFNKRTTVTFNEPVELPGQVLPAGTYTFTIVNSYGIRNIMQIWAGSIKGDVKKKYFPLRIRG